MKRVSRRTLLATLVGLPCLAGLPGLIGRARAARRPLRFDQHVEQTISAVIDCMLPGDDGLPGAVALGIDRRVPAMAEVSPRLTLRELQRSLAEGAAWLDRAAVEEGAPDFLGLDRAKQEAVLLQAMTADADGAFVIVRMLRDRAFALYYTHQTVMAAFPYTGPPQPVGFPDFQEAPR
jgi:Gluconate 2-dehydrogenase subunit 3